MNVAPPAFAPGKVVLMGEYSVLEGAPALAAATGHRARAEFCPWATGVSAGGEAGARLLRIESPQLGPMAQLPISLGSAALAGVPANGALIASLAALVHERLTGAPLPAGVLTLDTSAFFVDGKKMGVGSSAAVLVAASRALAAAAGVPEPSVEALIALHRQWQGGRGSGVDVATSAVGGVVRFQLPDKSGSTGAAGSLAVPMDPARGPAWAAICVGHPSSTADALAAAAMLKREHPATYWSHLEELAHLSVAACEFWALGERVAFLPLAERACQVLASFGKAMGIDVVTREHVDLSSRVRAIGGAYKPSGAGGGDVGVAFFVNVRARRALARALRGTAYRIVAES